MAIDIKPELHDLLKLVGSSSKHACPHNYESELKNIIGTDVWMSLQHHCVEGTNNHKKAGLNCDIYPINKELFCLHYADILASVISRRLRDIYKSRTVFKAWKHNKEPFIEDIPKDNILLLNKINSIKDFSHFIRDNEHLLRERPEDVGGCPFASLHSHSKLVKHWYDFLLKHAHYFEIPDTIKTADEVLTLVSKIENTKAIYIGYITIRTDTLLVRLRDTYLLNILKGVLQDCINALGATLLYDLFQESLIVLPGNEKLEKIMDNMRNKLSSNFYLEMNFKESKLPYKKDSQIEKDFRNCVSQLFEEPEKRLYQNLDKEIKPIASNKVSRKAVICDLCQKASATEEFGEETIEYLCKGCHDLRKKAPRYSVLAEWEKIGNSKIALLEISLDTEHLLKTLSNCFNKQLSQELFEHSKGNASPQDFGFSIIFEFLEDYKKFISEVKDEIDKKRRFEIVLVLNNLFIIKIEDLKDLMSIADKYGKIYKEHFPKLLEIKQSPIYLSISCANIKYPFFEHWKFLEDYKQSDKRYSIFINIAGKGSIETEIWNMENVIDFYKDISVRGDVRALHKLSEIAKFSETFADKIMHERRKGDKEDPTYKTYKKLMDPARPHGLDYKSLLTLAKIIGD